MGERQSPPNPLQEARAKLDASLTTSEFQADTVRESFQGYKTEVIKNGQSPEQVYSHLIDFAKTVADKAETHNDNSTKEYFTGLQEGFKGTLDFIQASKTSAPASQPTPPASIRSQTGRAAG